jgi:hypothetical protein
MRKQKSVMGDAVSGLQTLLMVVAILGLLGIFGGFFGLMQSEIQTDLISNSIGTVTNETGAWINETTYTVDQSTADGFGGLVITALYNATDDSPILTTNVTVSGSGFTNASTTNWDDVLVSYTYTYNTYDDSYYYMGNASSAQTKIFGKLPLTATIIVFTFLMILILGVVGYFLARNRIPGGTVA